MGPTVTKALQALNSSVIPSNLNHTHIALILKKRQPIGVADYHPISLCYLLYKLITKFIVNRLKIFLLNLISESQSAFVTRRQISDNILVAYEIVHFFRKKGK